MEQPVTRYSPSPDIGLTTAQVEERTAARLTNVTRSKITKSNFAIFRDNALTLFNGFNFLIGVFLAMVGAWRSLLFLLVVLLNITIGIVQEIRGRNLVSKLTLIVESKAKAVRSGKEQEIAAADAVLDDVLIFDAGAQICADAVVMEGQVEVNESLLTGESNTVIKNKGDTLLSGSYIISGKCKARADKIGNDSFAAKLALGAKKHKVVNSELVRSMRRITRVTTLIVVPIGAILFLQAYFLRNQSLYDSVTTSSAALLGMLPRGLVLLISIALAVGVINLAKKKVLVQDQRAIEMLARVDLLCLDKTGTITTGEMKVTNFAAANNIPLDPKTALTNFVAATDDNNSTAAALRDYFSCQLSVASCQNSPQLKTENCQLITSKTPFSSERKWSSVTFSDKNTIIVGAPERLTEKHQGTLPKEIAALKAQDKRILYAAYTKNPVTGNTLPSLTVFAAIEITDQIRHNAPETLKFFKREGVGVKVISGDNPVTVSQAAAAAGLEDYQSYVDMSAITTDDALKAAAAKYSVFGRVSPEQKKQLILAFKEQGRTVAMVGDGVNDVLALREADCGIALSCGSEASRQVSQLVLTDSDFTSLPDVVLEGRRVINNIGKIGGIFFIKTIYSVLLSVLMSVLNLPFPFVPIQITLIDLVIEGYPSFFMSFERETYRPKHSFLNNAFMRALPFGIMVIVNICILYIMRAALNIPDADVTTMMFLLLAFISAASVFRACFPFNKLRLFLSITSSLALFAAIFLTMPDWNWFVNSFLYLTVPNAREIWLTVLLCVLTVPVMLGLIKFLKPGVGTKPITRP